MIIGVVRESSPGETRVAATPLTVVELLKLGYDVVVDSGAGAGSTFSDEAYEEAGAAVGDALSADIVFGVNAADVEVSATGYAKEMSDDYNQREADLYAAQAADVDIIITTALIPGKPAPRLLTAEMVASMKPGSVLVDMAASNGGNVEGTVPDQAVVTANGVTIIGYTDLPASCVSAASPSASPSTRSRVACPAT